MQKAKRSNPSPLLLCFILLVLFGLWLVYIPLPSPKTPLVLYDSENTSLRSPLVTLIHTAKKQISLSSFSLDDAALVKLLDDKEKQGCDVSLTYDRRYKNKVLKHFGSRPYLKPHKVKGLVHEKTALMDNETLILSSANLTLSSTLAHHNLSLGLYSPELARLWQSKAQGSVQLGSTHLSFYRLPTSARLALKALYTRLDRAQKTITIAMFTLTHQGIIEHLTKAIARGVDVTVFADYTCAKGASKKALTQLGEAGAHLYMLKGLTLLHHKWALIDERALFFGSANWTKAAFTKNQDFLLCLEPLEKGPKRQLKKVIKRLRSACQKG